MRARETFQGDGSPPSGRRRRLSAMQRWEQEQLRRLGLTDVEWDAERYCPCCISERLAREELARGEVDEPPPSGTRRR
jgi:hypothetical protein